MRKPLYGKIASLSAEVLLHIWRRKLCDELYRSVSESGEGTSFNRLTIKVTRIKAE